MRRSEIVRKQVAAPPPLKLNAPAQSLTAAVISVSLTEKKKCQCRRGDIQRKPKRPPFRG